VAKAILNISNYSGGLNNKTNSRDIEDNQFQDLDSLSIETPGKLKVMGAVNDYAGSITADTATGVKYGNGLFHFNADYDIDDTTALIENNEILFVNTDSGSSNAPIVKPFELTKTVNNVVSNKLTYSSRTDITYGDTWSEVDYNAVDGVVRITPTSFVETNKPIKLQHINENYYLGADSSNVLFGDTGKTLTSAVVEGTTSATTTSTNESSDFNVGDKIKFQITFGTFTFTSLPVELTGVTSTEIQFAAFGGMSVYAIGAKVLKASNSVNLLQSEIGWKKLDSITGKKIPNNERMQYKYIEVIITGATIPSEADVNAKIQEIKDQEKTAEDLIASAKTNLIAGKPLSEKEASLLF